MTDDSSQHRQLSAGHETRRIDLPADVLSAAEARAFVRQVLRDWGLPGMEPETTLAVSELVTNAVIHAHSATRVILHDMDGVIQLRVADQLPDSPDLVFADKEDLGGRGMLLVDSVSESWGVDDCPPGKVVWLDITKH